MGQSGFLTETNIGHTWKNNETNQWEGGIMIDKNLHMKKSIDRKVLGFQD